ESAWRETFGFRNFPPTLMAKRPNFFARKMRSLGAGDVVTSGLKYFVYTDKEGHPLPEPSFRIDKKEGGEAYDVSLVKDQDGESLYVFRWHVQERSNNAPTGRSTEVTFVRTASGDFARWDWWARKEIPARTTEDSIRGL